MGLGKRPAPCGHAGSTSGGRAGGTGTGGLGGRLLGCKTPPGCKVRVAPLERRSLGLVQLPLATPALTQSSCAIAAPGRTPEMQSAVTFCRGLFLVASQPVCGDGTRQEVSQPFQLEAAPQPSTPPAPVACSIWQASTRSWRKERAQAVRPPCKTHLQRR